MTKKLDQDIQGLKLVLQGMEKTSPAMRQANLQFAWDKYVIQPLRQKLGGSHD